MSTVPRICAFYSRGPHYMKMIKALRRRWPDGHIVALIPPAFRQESVAGKADEVQTTAGSANARAVLRQIRTGKYDIVAVMFASAKLRLLAVLSGASGRYCYTMDGRLVRLRLGLLSLLFATVWRRLRGEITYRRIRYVVRHRPVPKKESAL